MNTLLLTIDAYQQQYSLAFLWLDVALKTSLIFLVGLLFHLLLRRQSAASLLGLVWLTVLLAALAVPLIRLLSPALQVGVIVVPPVAPFGPDSLSWLPALLLPALALYLTGVLVLSSYLGIGIWRLLRLTSYARPTDSVSMETSLRHLMTLNGMTARVSLLVSDRTDTPFTWGLFHHRLVLPKGALDWDAALLSQAISHELGHVQRNDWIFQLLARLTLCLYWPNPLVWFAVRTLKIESEKACDDAAIDCTGSDVDYADNLLRLAHASRGGQRLPVPGLFGKVSILSLRIRHILSPEQDRAFLRSDEIAFTALMILLLVIPLSALRITASVAEEPASQIRNLPLVFHDTDDSLTRIQDSWPGLPVERPRPADMHPVTKLDPPVRRIAAGIDTRPGDRQTEWAGFVLAQDDLFENWEATPLQIHLPDYPPGALKKGIEGYVIAEYSIDELGRVYDPIIIESVPTGTFDKSVLRAVEKFVYCTEVVDGIGGNNQTIRNRFSFNLMTSL